MLAEALAHHGVTRCAIMASTFRSGSTWIGRIMDRHGLHGMKHERLRHVPGRDVPGRDVPGQGDCRPAFAAMLAHVPGPVFASRLLWPQRNRLAQSLGLGRADCARFAAQFPAADWLWLRRRDVFAQGISYWRARRTGCWHVQFGDHAPPPAPDYDFAAIDTCVREIVLHDRLWQDFFAVAEIAPSVVWYEDLLTDTSPVARFMARFGHDLVETDSDLMAMADAHSAACRDRYLDELFRRSKGLDSSAGVMAA
jgi:LPS sulfotransferase NodH